MRDVALPSDLTLITPMLTRDEVLCGMKYPGLSLDEATHVYTLCGKQLPISVTGVIKTAGLMGGSDFFTPEAAMRGTVVHKAVELWLRGTLDEATVDDSIKPYLDAAQKFFAEHFCEVWQIENPIYHPIYLYPCTPDWIGTVNGIGTVIDFKSGPQQKWHGLQLAANAEAWNRWQPQYRAMSLLTVHLSSDGNYRIVEHDANDFRFFLTTLSFISGRGKYGYNE